MTSYPPPPPPAPQRPPSIYQQKRFIIPATIVAVLIALNLLDIVRGGRGKDVKTAVPTASETFVPRPRSASSATLPSETAEATSSEPVPESSQKSPAASLDGSSFTMPDLTGSTLQDAQNAVQKLGIFFSVSHDLRGSRNQILDRNWKVCDQQPAAGETVSGSRISREGKIDFGVVKRSETCP